MKRIGILTFHRSINYGAFMQSYALSNELKNRYGDIVEIIDFEKLSKHLMYKKTTEGVVNAIVRGNEEKIKYRRFQEDLKLLPLSTPSLITNDYDAVFDYINNRYDIVVVGSDAVWAYNKGLGLKNPYWLFADKLQCVKMSYAASAHSLDVENISQEEKDYIASCLKSFAYIGVRDVTTYNLVKSCDSSLDVNMNCDPTVLLNVPEDDLGRKILIDKLGIGTNKKIISVMLGQRTPMFDILREQLKGSDYQYIALYKRVHWTDRFNWFSIPYLYNLSPYEWYHIYACMFLNITTFFHGTLLALKSGVPTFSFDVTRMGEKYVSKLKYVLADMTLSDYYFDININTSEEKKRFIELLHNTIEQRDLISAKINQYMEMEKKKSQSFFDKLETFLTR